MAYQVYKGHPMTMLAICDELPVTRQPMTLRKEGFKPFTFSASYVKTYLDDEYVNVITGQLNIWMRRIPEAQ